MGAEPEAADDDQNSSRKWVSVTSFDEVYIQDPGWGDVPPVSDAVKETLRDEVRGSVPGILSHGASRRFEIISELAAEYVRYRRAGCSREESNRRALQAVCDTFGVTQQTVFDHVANLNLDESESITKYLERVFAGYRDQRTQETRVLMDACGGLVEVGTVLAEIEATPPVSPADIRFQDVYQDRPGERDSVFAAEDDPQGFLSHVFSQEASVSEPHRYHQGEDLKTIVEGGRDYVPEDSTVRTRDITTYDTDYSRVLRKIAVAVKNNMSLWSKQKLNPSIGAGGDDNSAIRAAIQFPPGVDRAEDNFVYLEMQYWENGSSRVSLSTHPLGRRDKGPSLDGPIEDISRPDTHTLVGHTIKALEQDDTIQS